MTQEQPEIVYVSYNGLARRPMFWGIPYMTALGIVSVSLLGGMMLGVIFGPVGWLFGLIGIPIALFVRGICSTDDRAVEILILEIKWIILKIISGNAKYHGGTMAIAPATYGRKFKNVKRYFKKTVRG
jgi:type IV secretion system protein VirB3